MKTDTVKYKQDSAENMAQADATPVLQFFVEERKT